MPDLSQCIIHRSEEKDILLRQTRNIGFEDIKAAIYDNRIIAIQRHTSPQFAHQYILIVHIHEYTYDVPLVYDIEHQTIFLKTIYPNRKHLYLIPKKS